MTRMLTGLVSLFANENLFAKWEIELDKRKRYNYNHKLSKGKGA